MYIYVNLFPEIIIINKIFLNNFKLRTVMKNKLELFSFVLLSI